MSITLPHPADYPSSADFDAAYRQYEKQFLAKLAALGARTTDCPCGYTPFDSCPVHD